MKIIPAILTNNLLDLKQKIKVVETLTDWAQIDVMDGKFVSNYSARIDDLAQIKTNLRLEAHLMVEHPLNYLEACRRVNMARVVFHLESADNPTKVLHKLGQYKIPKGLALNPKTRLEEAKPYLAQIDFLLLLGVTPGKQGQTFIIQTLEKIKNARRFAPRVTIGVDGGINLANISNIVAAGAQLAAVGSGLWESQDIRKRWQKLQKKISNMDT